jgi:hypothetical protein
MTYSNPAMEERKLPEYISVISASQCARIKIDDIEVIEQEGRRLHIITADREYCFYENLRELVMTLSGRAFYTPVKGLIINFDHVREIKGNSICFYSGQCVTMGKNSITKARSAYKKYLMKYPPYSLWEGPGNTALQPEEDPLLRSTAGRTRKNQYPAGAAMHVAEGGLSGAKHNISGYSNSGIDKDE